MAGRAADPRELMINPIFNAVDAMPDGGTITLRTHAGAHHAALEVSDTGRGMSEEVRRRCLEPFFTTKGQHGTGLGLAMVHGILRRHGGSIRIESAPGCGATFTIWLPLAGRRASDGGAPPSERELSPGPLRVLVADDELPVRRVITKYLETSGHSVRVVGNGRQALAEFRAGQFELVITDRAMPQMNGDDLAWAVKQLSPDTPVLMLTGFGSLMQDDDLLPDGVDLVVSKPVILDGLQEAMARVLLAAPGRRQERQAAALPGLPAAPSAVGDAGARASSQVPGQ